MGAVSCLRSYILRYFSFQVHTPNKRRRKAADELAVRIKNAKYTQIKSRGIHTTIFGVETIDDWCKNGKKINFVIGEILIFDKLRNKKAKNDIV